MDFSYVLKELRVSANLKQKELADIFHVSQQTVAKWENGKSEPNTMMLKEIAQYFSVTVDELLGINKSNEYDVMDESYRTTIRDVHDLVMLNFDNMCNDVDEKTLDRIHSVLGSIRRIQNNTAIDLENKKYLFACIAEIIGRIELFTDNLESAQKYNTPKSALNEYNKRFINCEVEVLKEITETIGFAKKPSNERGLVLPFYQTPASAGLGSVIGDDTPLEWISLPKNERTKSGDFILEVRGDSMIPKFYDGDRILVAQSQSIYEGEIGVFILNGESYVKKMGRGELISLNPGYKPIVLNEYDDVRCIGKVIDKVDLE